MKASFSFCGVDIAEFGLSYAPEIQDTYVYKPSDFSVHDQTFDSHHGGYFYGITRQPKEFILRCIFEEKQIDKGIMSQIFNLFRAGRSGKLIFSRRPWCYYYATVTQEPDLSGLTNYLNGAVVINMKAYYPFARSDYYYRTRTETEYDNIKKNSAVPFLPEMVPNYVFEDNGIDVNAVVLASTDSPVTQANPLPYILLNPGTERAAVGIQIAGDVNKGVTITNATTRQECKFVAMSSTEFDGDTSWVYTDSINGKTTIHKNNIDNINFLYHDHGFIELEPAYPAVRDLYIVYTPGYNVEVRNILHEDLSSQYIYLKDGWHKIVKNLDEHHLQVHKEITGSATMSTMVVRMNELYVKPDDTMNITRLRLFYKPTYS